MQKRKRPVMTGVLSILNIVIGALTMLGSLGKKSGYRRLYPECGRGTG